jgi:hypothetical protein
MINMVRIESAGLPKADDKQVKVIPIDVSKIRDDNGNLIDLKSTSRLRRWLIKQYNRREVVISDNEEIVRFTKTGLQDSLKRRGEAHQQVYAELDNLLKNSIYYGNESGDKRHPYIERQDIYYAVAKIGNDVLGVRFKIDIEKRLEYGAYKDRKVVKLNDVDEIDIKESPSPYAGLSPAGTEGDKSIPISRIRAAMGLNSKIL